MLKRPGDLPFDHEDGRKKVAVNTLGENDIHVADDLGSNLESDSEELLCRALNPTIEKGKGKGKNSKRKAREQPPCSATGRVATRADTKRR